MKFVHEMQVLAFAETLEKYQDFETNPGAESIERVIRRHNQFNSNYYLIDYDEKSVGAIRIVTDSAQSVARISPMFILPEDQNNGFGEMAVRESMKLFTGAKKWELDTIQGEKRLCRFYERLGFRQTGEIEMIKPGMNIVYYELDIVNK